MPAIGLGMTPPSLAYTRLPGRIRVPAGRVALTDSDGRYLTDANGAVLLEDKR